MLKTRIAKLLLIAPLFTAYSWAGPVAEHHGANPTAVNGVYSITFNLNIQSTLPANSTIVCKAQITPPTSPFANVAFGPVALESASGVAAVTGSTATCSVEIPFSWTVDSTRGGASLSYEIDAVNVAGALPATVRTSMQQGIAEPYPSSGSTSNLAFNLTF